MYILILIYNNMYIIITFYYIYYYICYIFYMFYIYTLYTCNIICIYVVNI